MNTLKGWITTLVLAMTLMTSTAFADGVIIGGRGSNSACKQTVTENVDHGVIIGGFASEIIAKLTGLILGGKTGVIIGGKGTPAEDCGVIIGG